MQHLKLNFIGFITDSCSIGLSAGKFIVTPTSEMIPLGCSYLGLLVDDWKYWACYRRPAIKTADGSMFTSLPIIYIHDGNH